MPTITGGSNAVYIRAGGYLTVTTTGHVYGFGVYGVYGNNGGAITNSGTIGCMADGVVVINGSAVTNTSSGTISGGLLGVYAGSGSALTNSGTISGLRDGANVSGSRVTNTSSGTISSSGRDGIDTTGGSTITNSGLISGHNSGVNIDGSALINSGTIRGSSYYGVIAQFGGVVTNTGFIYGARDGVYAFRSTVTNGGTIGGAGGAVETATDSTLNVLSGAVFEGSVTDDGTGVLNLAGTAAGTLDMGGSFSGFAHISFGSAAWTLEGTANEIASGETISGFAPGDALELEGFAATYATYISGAGVVLSNAGGSETIDVSISSETIDVSTGLVTSEALILSTDGTNSTLFAAEVSTISTYVPHSVKTNNGTYAPALSITSTGMVHGIGYGVYTKGGTVTNSGSIYGSKYGVYADASTVTNNGTISGGTDAVDTKAGSALNILSGAVFKGDVLDDGTGVLNLAGTTAGTLDMGGSFTGFEHISFGSALWTLAGNASELANGETISGIAGRDVIVLESFAATAATYIAGTGLVLSNTSGSETINTGAGLSFYLSSDGSNSTLFTEISTISTYVPHAVKTNNGTYAVTLSITNTGTVSGGFYGLDIINGTVTNSGTILGFTAVDTNAGALTNNGTISGSFEGIGDTNASTIINNGTISGSVFGVYTEAGTVTNGGVISSGNYAVETKEGAILNVLSGAVFEGLVKDDGTGVLILAGTTAGTLDIGGSFTGFKHISFGSAAWTLEGTTSELVNGETISGFTLGDTITLDGFTATSETYVSGAGLELGDGTSEVTIDITGSFSGNPFSLSDTPQGTDIFLCFLAGTRIATLEGEVAVEELAIGGRVVTRFGGARTIKWIGRQRYRQPFLGQQQDRLPVRIEPGALGGGLPLRELLVSPGHSLLLGEVLVLAKHLINGVTITQGAVEEVDYYNIELNVHDCVLAEGCWAESYADAPGQRAQFHNAATFHALYPDHVETQMLTLCAPRYVSGPELAGALAPVATQAAGMVAPGILLGYVEDISANGFIQGWALDEAHPALPVLLEILQQGVVIGTVLACGARPDVAAAGHGKGGGGFTFQTAFALDPADIAVRRAADGAVLGLAHPLRQSLAA